MAYAATKHHSSQSSAPSSVHTEETTPPPQPFDSYRDKLINRDRPEFEASASLYDSVDDRDYSQYWYALRACRTDAWFAVSTVTRKVTVLSNACRLRWCPICSTARAHTIAHQVRGWLEPQSKPKLLTLTLKHSDESLESQIHRLYACFDTLRRRKWFASKVRGGIWFFQVKKSKETDQWHPHLHCLLDAEFLPFRAIKENWMSITGNSDVIDIRAIWNPARAADYVSRYAARPANLNQLSHTDRLVVYDSLKGRRLCGSWGKAKSIRLSANSNQEFKNAVNVMTWKSAQFLIHSDAFAAAVYEAYKSGDPLPLNYSLTPIESSLPQLHTDSEPEPPPPPKQAYISDWCSNY